LYRKSNNKGPENDLGTLVHSNIMLLILGQVGNKLHTIIAWWW